MMCSHPRVASGCCGYIKNDFFSSTNSEKGQAVDVGVREESNCVFVRSWVKKKYLLISLKDVWPNKQHSIQEFWSGLILSNKTASWEAHKAENTHCLNIEVLCPCKHNHTSYTQTQSLFSLPGDTEWSYKTTDRYYLGLRSVSDFSVSSASKKCLPAKYKLHYSTSLGK